MQTHTAQLGFPFLPPAPSMPPAVTPALGALKVGDRIACAGRFGPFRSCDSCGSTEFVVEPGAGPHAAGLRCDRCGARGRWLPRTYLATETLFPQAHRRNQ
jgi:hypothetical protein